MKLRSHIATTWKLIDGTTFPQHSKDSSRSLPHHFLLVLNLIIHLSGYILPNPSPPTIPWWETRTGIVQANLATEAQTGRHKRAIRHRILTLCPNHFRKRRDRPWPQQTCPNIRKQNDSLATLRCNQWASRTTLPTNPHYPMLLQHPGPTIAK